LAHWSSLCSHIAECHLVAFFLCPSPAAQGQSPILLYLRPHRIHFWLCWEHSLLGGSTIVGAAPSSSWMLSHTQFSLRYTAEAQTLSPGATGMAFLRKAFAPRCCHICSVFLRWSFSCMAVTWDFSHLVNCMWHEATEGAHGVHYWPPLLSCLAYVRYSTTSC
jgi:hypothetical protein